TPLEHALELARDLTVFPCRPDDKRPLVPHGFHDASRDPKLIEFWWKRWPNALVAVPSGEKFVFVDVDLQHEQARQWLDQHRGKIPVTRTHRTRSGGLHFLFRPSAAVKCSTSKIAPRIDTRGTGGYIAWWPAHGFEVLHKTILATVPRWLLEALNPEPPPIVRRSASLRPMSVSLRSVMRVLADA